MENILKAETKAQYKKQQFEKKLNSWKNKPLNGQHLRNIDGKHDHNSTWAWLELGTLKKETMTMESQPAPPHPNHHLPVPLRKPGPRYDPSHVSGR